jgi:O-antigen/teichoic acid export membrane protein
MSRDELDDAPSPDLREADVPSAKHRDLTTRARTAILWVGSTTVVWQVCSWGLTLLTARILLPEDYGILALTETVSPFLAMLAALNLTTWIVQTDRFEAHDKAAMYSLTSLVGLAMALIGVSIAPLLGLFFENPEMVLPFQVISLTFVLRGTAVVPLASLQRELDFKPIALLNLSVGISRGVLQLTLAWLGFGYWSLIAGVVYREVASVAWAHYYVGLPTGFSWDPALYRRAIAFGVPATLALVAAVLFNASDKIVVGKLFDVELLGYYSMAFFLTDLPLARINSVLRPVFLPYFARLRDTPERMKEHFSRFVLAVASAIFPALLGVAVIATDLVGVVLGEKWLPMAQPLQVLCIVGLMRSYTDNIPHLLLAVGKPLQVLRVRMIYLAVMPLCFLLLARTWGIAGIYLTWLVAFPTCSIAVLLVLRKEVGITPWDYAVNLLAPALSSCTDSRRAQKRVVARPSLPT